MIRFMLAPVVHIRTKTGRAECRAPLLKGDTFTTVAMESNCVDCRNKLLVGPPGQKGCDIVKPKQWEPQPMPGAEKMIKQLRKLRDGR